MEKSDLEVLLLKQKQMGKFEKWCYKKGYHDTQRRMNELKKQLDKDILSCIPF